ncbi:MULTISPECIES: hypothetical protein [Legionella]|uniref:Uncharacterized protein n=1 Tax=Legionella resiliens TaxID=2905958 RepID=A0ABS8X3M8_9GAMM|nr:MULTISPECIES: hypothetical protein [unclassified Legionella]MCE0723428.1 hypothetical protein [Legionella sp. 9fVS26]MCE3532582.1 hypothetical protein [Legionella sp. 8cVS16]QLZ68714.1 hypothetical protein FOLKNPGA_01493 [Legionella sp. PC1000]
MFVTHFQRAITYLREAQEIALFTTLADARLSAIFRTSPLFYITLPFIGLLLTVNALINGYRLAKANNRNFDRWFLFGTSAVCALLASIALYGAAISMALGYSFAAAPWFFTSSLIVAWGHQLVMFGLNLYRALESPPNSIHRMHYIQAALGNLFAMTLLTFALGAVVFTLLFPIAPAVGTLFALTAVLFTGLDILWSVVPHALKRTVKGWFHLSKPDVIQDAIANQEENLKVKNFKEEEPNHPKHHRIFTCCDYSAVIRTMAIDAIKPYLLGLIQWKLQILRQKADLEDEKIKDKISLLTTLLNVIETSQKISKKDVLVKYPLAFQSFWSEKGEVEQIFDAVIVSKNRSQPSEIENLSPGISV